MLGQFLRLARSAEHVFHADEFDRAGTRLRQRFGDRAAQAAMDVVILGRDDGAGFLGAARQQMRYRSA